MTGDSSTPPRRPAPGARRVPAPPPVTPPPVTPPPVTPPPVTPPLQPPPVQPPVTTPPIARPEPTGVSPSFAPLTGAGPATPRVPGEGYTSSLAAPAQVVLGVGSGALVAIILTALSSNLWPIAILIFLVAAAVGVYLAPVTVTVESKRVTVSQGRRDRDPLVVYVAEIRDAGLREVTWVQCFGFGGVESDDRTTRLAVRAGTTLVLTMFDGSRVLVSVTDGPGALQAIEAAAAA